MGRSGFLFARRGEARWGCSGGVDGGFSGWVGRLKVLPDRGIVEVCAIFMKKNALMLFMAGDLGGHRSIASWSRIARGLSGSLQEAAVLLECFSVACSDV
jgi:hypothetical protein